MAVRGSALRRSTEGPLAGVLRDLDQRSRRMETRRRTRPPESEPEPGPPGPRGKPGPPGAPGRTVAAAVLTTGQDGRATWHPDPAHGLLVLAVTAGGVEGPYTAAVEEAVPGRVVVHVWCQVRAGRGLRWADAPEGTAVHVTGSLPDETPRQDV